MTDHSLPYLVNCSLMFTEEPLLRRPAAARAAGFSAVEFWWPFAAPVPADREVDAFTTAIEEAGVVDPAAQDELAIGNITLAAKAVAGIGATVLIEPVSGPKPYPLRTAGAAVGVVQRARAAGAANVGFLCDLYHLASNGDDVDAAIAAYAGVTAHVQIADAPGRGEPGSGELPLDRYLTALEDHGYRGWVSLEYKPTTTTEASLAWLPRERRAGKEL